MSNRRTSWEDNTTKVQIIAGLGIALQVISLILALAVKVKLWAWMGTGFGWLIQVLCAFEIIGKVENGSTRVLLTLCALFIPFGALIIVFMEPHRNNR